MRGFRPIPARSWPHHSPRLGRCGSAPDVGAAAQHRLLTPGQARQIARELYYEEYGIGDIDEFSVAAHVFDVVFNSSTVGAAMMLQDAMWETIKGTDLEAKYTRKKLPGSTVDEKDRQQILRISGTTIDVLNAIIERGLIDAFHSNLVARRTAYMRWIAENNPEKAKYLGGWITRAESYRD